MAIIGNTVKLHVVFTIDGEDTDPEELTFTAYERDQVTIIATAIVGGQFKTATGRYTYPYLIPGDGSTKHAMIVEFKGTYQGTIKTSRIWIPRTFVPRNL